MRNAILDRLSMTAKPVEWSDAAELGGLTDAVVVEINKLPVYKVSRKVGPSDPNGFNQKSQWYVVEQEGFWGGRYLVNSEGYDYARYVARLPKAK